MSRDYLRESLVTALDDAGIAYTPEQLSEVRDSLEVSRENESLATGREFVQNPIIREIEILREKAEQREAALRTAQLQARADREISDYRFRCRIQDMSQELERRRMQ